MKFVKEGEWMVGTPAYIGDPKAIKRAASCSHEFEEINRETKMDEGRAVVMALERCKKCVAVRAKYKDA